MMLNLVNMECRNQFVFTDGAISVVEEKLSRFHRLMFVGTMRACAERHGVVGIGPDGNRQLTVTKEDAEEGFLLVIGDHRDA
jgi:hypothetical protein